MNIDPKQAFYERITARKGSFRLLAKEEAEELLSHGKRAKLPWEQEDVSDVTNSEDHDEMQGHAE